MKAMKVLRLAILSIACMCLSYCSEDTENRNIDSETQLDNIDSNDVKNEPIIFIAQVAELSIRNAPDTEAALVGKIPYGGEVTFLDEITDFKEKITLRGVIKYEPWVKIKYNNAEGWTYKGGLLDQDDIYEQFGGDNSYRRSFEFISDKELTPLIEIEELPTGNFKGSIEYSKVDQNRFVKNGDFKFEGVEDVEISRNYTAQIKYIITGSFEEDVKEGPFEIQYQGYESNSTFTIYFKDGKCQWGMVVADAEGEDYSIREDNLKECTFSELGDLMKRKY
jgi:hypothetical protein